MKVIENEFTGKKEFSYFFQYKPVVGYKKQEFKVNYNPGLAKISVGGIGEIEGSCYSIERSEEHVCGLEGFGLSLEDSCQGCEEEIKKYEVLKGVRQDLVKKGLIKK
jgi:hypothetical protein